MGECLSSCVPRALAAGASAGGSAYWPMFTLFVLSISQLPTYTTDSLTPFRALTVPFPVARRMMPPPIFWAELWRSRHHHDQQEGHWVWFNGAVVGDFEAHLAAEATVAEYVGRGGRVMAGAETAKAVAAEEAADTKMLATAAKVLAASAKVRLWWRRPRPYRYK